MSDTEKAREIVRVTKQVGRLDSRIASLRKRREELTGGLRAERA